ncbi:LytS/YhcK type 5TM receptor domain-containing protein [Caldilinea sp.]|uniref:LytS/YhcK type 5TM receptor domain-containing protein n=1 Tax=Caldilinea sp. TaxID=2293560 RepID=UPI00262546DB|nr:LytS/YhcK type 5TM receptor domain-containing protein [uncultured Caldilinea sp.]
MFNLSGMQALLYNGALLLAMALIYDVIVSSARSNALWRRQAASGISIGVIGVLVMSTPWELTPGVIFDTRSVLLSLTGLFFGLLSSAIAVLMTALFRLYLGGDGALTGVIVIVVTTFIGVAWRQWRRPALQAISWRELYVFGLVVHLAMVAAMLTLPWPLSLFVLQTISLPVLVIYPIATLFMGLLLRQRRRRERAVEALEQSELRYRSYVDNAPHGVFVLDGKGRCQEVNPAACRLTGYTRGELLQRPFCDLSAPQSLDEALRHFEQVRREGYAQGELAYRRKNGEIGWWSVAAVRLSADRFLGYAVDITARKQAEQALRRRDALLESLSFAAGRFLQAERWEDEMPAVLEYLGKASGADGVFLFQNEAGPNGKLLASFRFEWTAPGAVAHRDNPLLQRASYETLGFARWVKLLSGGEAICDHVRNLPPGERALLQSIGVRSLLALPIEVERQWWGFLGLSYARAEHTWSDAEIEALRAVSRALGVTIEGLASRARLRQQADELAQIMEGVPVGLLLLDADGYIRSANPLAQEYLRWLTSDAECKQVTALGDQPLAKLLTSPTERWGHLVSVERRTFEVRAQLVERAPEPASWVVVIRDLTNELFVQQQLQRQQRLAAIGQLASGIAHDFNNLMSVIILYAQMMMQSSTLDEHDRERLRVIEKQGLRAARMIRQMLDFSRRTAIERQPLDLLPLLKEQVKLLQRILPENIQIDLETALNECYVFADPTQLEQAFMNLAVNARDAMPDGGKLRFIVEKFEFAREKDAPLPGMTPGEWVCLKVSDTGVGISPEDQEHIFEPFFTTKPAGVGVGLGLPQVHGIVGQHGGHISVASKVGVGTTFTIFLPALKTLEANIGADEIPMIAIPGNRETILLVEDEQALRTTLQEVLERWNYRVIAAANGKEALAILETMASPPDLILSDVVMPEMSGIALFRTLRQRQMDIPIIFLSGHLRGEDLEELRRHGLEAWLPKPPGVDLLAQTIATALRKGAGASDKL